MTQEEKAKAYDEALAKCKAYMENTKKRWSEEFCKATEKVFEEIFPQLRESEDERIRKWLLKCVKSLYDVNFVEVSRQDVLFYLEKQKEYCSDDVLSSTYQDGFEDGFKAGREVERRNSSDNDFIKPRMQEPWNKEKQKEPHYTKRNALFDKCVENCDPKTVEEVNKRVDDIINMPELSPFEQALTNFIGDWENDEEHWPSQFAKKHGKRILDIAREELQKEQRSAEWSKEDEIRLKEAIDALNESVKDYLNSLRLSIMYDHLKELM